MFVTIEIVVFFFSSSLLRFVLGSFLAFSRVFFGFVLGSS